MDADAARAAAEAAARHSYGRLVAYLAARSRDVAAAEDALAEAFAAALEQWPETGVPERPEAWLLAVARRRSIDAVRRAQRAGAAQEHLTLIAEELAERAEEDDVPDERLRLMFACAHPAIDPSVRAPLILQTVLGLEAATIASAFLVAPSTMAQRLVRAKLRIRDAGIPFRVPDRAELPERLDAVLSAIYAAFSEGWSDADGADARRRGLAGEAIWLGRLAASLMPQEPEALGLLALMLFAEARHAARRDADGRFVALAEQDCQAWDASMLDEAEMLLHRASSFGPTGRYQLEAAIQSAHVARRYGRPTDWQAIRALYEALLVLVPSPVTAINRAVAVAETDGAAAGLAELDRLEKEPRLETYQPYWAARAELAARAGDAGAARTAYERAIGLATDPAVRDFLTRRRDALG